MNISLEKQNELNAILKIAIEPADYSDKVEKNIKDYAKKVQMPGFRKGMVPAGHVKRMYGKSMLVDGINDLLNDTINNYLTDNKVDILGQPLIKTEILAENDWDFDRKYDFEYELGLAPAFEPEFTTKDKFTKHKVVADAATVDKRVKSLQRSYGSYTNPESTEAEDMIYAELVQLGTDGNPYEGGITQSNWLAWNEIADDKTKKALTGKSKDTVITVNAQTLFGKDADKIAKFFKIENAIAADLKSDFSLTIKNIARMEEAAINQELFDKIYGEGVVTTEEEMRKRVKEEYEGMLQQSADNMLRDEVTKYGIDKYNVGLPDDFLKRWLKQANEKPLTDEQIAADYGMFADNLRWTLVENRIMQAHDIKVDYNEILEMAKMRLAQQYAMYGMPLQHDQLEKTAADFLKERENVNRIFEEVKGQKVFDYIKSVVTVNEKEIDYPAFEKLVESKK